MLKQKEMQMRTIIFFMVMAYTVFMSIGNLFGLWSVSWILVFLPICLPLILSFILFAIVATLIFFIFIFSTVFKFLCKLKKLLC